MEFVDPRTLSRHNPTPPSRDTVTYPLRCGGNRHLAMVRQLSPNSIALASPSRVPHREAQTTCGQKTLILYSASGYLDTMLLFQLLQTRIPASTYKLLCLLVNVTTGSIQDKGFLATGGLGLPVWHSGGAYQSYRIWR